MAVYDRAKTLAFVGPLHIEAIPILGRLLLLANRSGGLTDWDISCLAGNHDELRALADGGYRSGFNEAEMAGGLILRWLDEPILSEMAAKNMILAACTQLLRSPRAVEPLVLRTAEARWICGVRAAEEVFRQAGHGRRWASNSGNVVWRTQNSLLHGSRMTQKS